MNKNVIFTAQFSSVYLLTYLALYNSSHMNENIYIHSILIFVQQTTNFISVQIHKRVNPAFKMKSLIYEVFDNLLRSYKK